MDRAKLAELRKKKAAAKVNNHKELLDSNTSIKDAILFLADKLNDTPFDDSNIVKQLASLKESVTFTEDVKRLENALLKYHEEPLKIENFSELLEKVGEIQNGDVVKAINQLSVTLAANTASQEAKDYTPVRRVRKVGDRFIFDDAPMSISVSGGGGGSGTASVQPALIRTGDDGQAIAIVNPDGTPIAIGSGGDASAAKQDEQTAVLEDIRDHQLTDGHNVSVDNLPSEYPLPAAQIITLTPQTDALTDTQLRASPVVVDTNIIQPTTPSDTQPISAVDLPLPDGAATESKQDDLITAINNSNNNIKAISRYSISAISEDATYKYFWFEADNLDYYIMRKHKVNSVFDYTRGTGGYSAVYQSPTQGPSGTPTWANYGSTF